MGLVILGHFLYTRLWAGPAPLGAWPWGWGKTYFPGFSFAVSGPIFLILGVGPLALTDMYPSQIVCL